MSGKMLTIDVAGNKAERPTSFPTVVAAESASFLPGETCSVLETRRSYQFDATSSEARDGKRVLAPAGGGRLLATKTGSDDVEIPKIGTPDHQSLTQSLQVGLSTGACNGNFVTDAGSGAINIASGEGMIRAANSSDSEIFAFRWPAVNGVTIPLNSARYVGVEYNSGSPQAVVRTTNNWNGQTEFQAATVVNEGGTLHILNNPQESCDGIQKIFHRLIETQPFQFAERLGGGRFSEVGTRNLSLSPCEFYDGLNEFPVTTKNTSTGDTFDSYYGSFTKVASQTQWDNQNYDNAGTLTTLSANRYGVHWLYIEMDDSFALVYGQGNYTTISDAEAALPPASLPLRLSLGSRLAAKLIFQKGAASAIQIESAFDTKFQSGMPVAHGDLINIPGNGDFHLSEAERDAAIRTATTSQSGLATAAQISRLNASPIITCYYTPSPTKIPLTAQPADIVSVTHTPTLSTGIVIFDFEFFVSSDGAFPFIAHFHNYFDNDLKYKWTETGRADPGDGMRRCRVIVNNYTGAKTCKVQAKEFSSSYPAKIHETSYMDGAASSLIVPWSCIVTEII